MGGRVYLPPFLCFESVFTLLSPLFIPFSPLRGVQTRDFDMVKYDQDRIYNYQKRKNGGGEYDSKANSV